MAKTRDYFLKAGADHFKAGQPVPVAGDSWQSKAFREGFDSAALDSNAIGTRGHVVMTAAIEAGTDAALTHAHEVLNGKAHDPATFTPALRGSVCAKRARKLRKSGRAVHFVGRTVTGKPRYMEF